MEIEGWILDAYAVPGEMVVWVKKPDGEAVRLTDRWNNAIYVSADNRSSLDYLTKRSDVQSLITSSEFVLKREHVFDYHEREVLKLALKNANEAEKLARTIERCAGPDEYRIYNADLLPGQVYFIEKDLFPLAKIRAVKDGDTIQWTLLDSNMAADYELPPLRRAHLKVEADASGAIPKFTDPIGRVKITTNNQVVEIAEGVESEKILSAVRTIARIDPDLLFIDQGDDFTTHYLAERAYVNGISDKLILSRDPVPLRRLTKRGTSYWAYNRVLHTPTSHQIFGRVNLDAENFFVYSECGLDGLFEIVRLCRMPIHKGSRASIGKCLSSLQAYIAFKDNLLIPWKPTRAEVPKTAKTLLLGDRGGFIYEPRVGVHERVGEVDYSSLFPFIMKTYNISAETVLCKCCPDSKCKVPEVEYNLCEKRRGVIPRSLEAMLYKRLTYKRLKKETKDPQLARIYQSRVEALKGLGVCCLTRESPVLIQRNGETQYVKIGDFIDSLIGNGKGVIDCPPGIFVSGLDRDLHSRFCKVRKLVKVPNHNNILRFTMDDERKIATTLDHPFFVLNEGGLETRAAETIKEGDLIPVAKRIPYVSKQINSIDLLDWLQKNTGKSEQLRWKVSGSILKNAIAVNRKRITNMAVEEGYTPWAVGYWKRMGMIPLAFFPSLSIPVESRRDLRVGIGRRQRKAGGRTSWLPAIIPISEALGFFLGLYVSDGSARPTFIRIDIATSQEGLLQSAREVVRTLFQIPPRIYKERKADMYVLQINSLALVNFVERVIGLPGSSEKGKLKVPTLIFNSNQSTAEGFLEGLLAGNGTAEKDRNFVCIGTANPEFANQLGFLATTLNLGFRIDKHSREPMRPIYCVNFVGPETLTRIANWCFLNEAHLSILKPKLGKPCNPDCSHPRYKTFPVRESGLLMLARATRTVKPSRLDNRLSTCPIRAERALRRIDARKFDESLTEASTNLHRLIESDLGFLRVKEVEKLESNDAFVYCFQIDEDDLPGFFAGEGAVYTHNCFGYLSYRNAKFGLIDCHISVCAFARKILLDTARIAERRGFEVVHGIVDSLWVKKPRARKEDFEALCREIQEEIGLPISFEGIYRWAAFLPSRMHEDVPVLNRYFGVFQDGTMKIRGIEARRRDTIKLVSDCQKEILELFATAQDVAGVKALIPKAVQIFAEYARLIWSGEIPISDLVIVNGLSKDWNQYDSNLAHVSAVRQLADEGLELMAGQSVSYVVTNYRSKAQEVRVRPTQLLDQSVSYDKEHYTELLVRGVASILEPFGVSKEGLKRTIGVRGQHSR